MSLDIFSEKEKLDYIYLTMRKNEKRQKINMYFSWGYRVIILLYMLYFFFITIPSILDKIPSFTGDGESMKMQEILNNPKMKELYDTYFGN